MKLFHIVISCCVGLFIYFVLQALWGPAGITALAEIESYKTRLEANIDQLQAIQVQMNSDLDRLASDTSRLRSEAYRIGMVGNDEVRIRLPQDHSVAEITPGTIATKPQENTISQALITGAAISVSLILLLILTFIRFEADMLTGGKQKRRRRPVPYQGVRTQTASLE